MALPVITVSPTLTSNHLFTVAVLLSPSEVPANAIVYENFNVPEISTSNGVTPDNQVVSISKVTEQDGLCVLAGRVTTDNQITLCFINSTNAPILPPQNEVYTLVIFKPNTPIDYFSQSDFIDTIPPGIPTGLTATVISPTQINLAWNPSTDNVAVTGYEIYRNGLVVATLTDTQYSDTGLTASTLYIYGVQAYDAALNKSGLSPAVQATTASSIDTTAPTVPTSVTATAISISQINLSWSASTDAFGVLGYYIHRDGALIGTTASTSYSDTGLLPSTLYSYTVSAYDAALNESANSSPAATATTMADVAPPSAPATLTASTVSATAINLLWTAATDNVAVAGYQIWINGVFSTSTFNALTYQVSGLTAGTTYTFSVKAFDVAGNVGGFSNSASATTTAVNTNYLNVTVTSGATTGFNLTTLAPLDWVKCGVTTGALNRTEMSTGAGINALSAITSALACVNGANTFTWTDGTPTASGTNNNILTNAVGLGAGILFDADIGTTEKTLTFYTDTYIGNALITISLSDSSVTPYTYAINGLTVGSVNHKIVAVCKATGAGVKVQVRYECTAKNAAGQPEMGLSAITLQNSSTGGGELPPTGGNIGVLQVTKTLGAATAVNLTTLGSIDWWKYGITAATYDTSAKSIVIDRQIGGAYTIVPGFDSQTTSSQTFTWTDGVPTASGTTNAQCLVSQATVGSGWEIIVKADSANKRVFTIYGQVYSCTAKLTATISDASSAGLSDTVVAGNGVTTDLNYAIVFKPVSANATLTVRLEIVSIPGATAPNIKIAASTLAISP